MKVAKIKFSESQVRMLITGETVVLRLPDAEVHLTMDQTVIELRKAADKLKGVGAKPSFMDEMKDLFETTADDTFRKDNLFDQIMSRGKKK